MVDSFNRFSGDETPGVCKCHPVDNYFFWEKGVISGYPKIVSKYCPMFKIDFAWKDESTKFLLKSRSSRYARAVKFVWGELLQCHNATCM